jgi:hypothetical protein
MTSNDERLAAILEKLPGLLQRRTWLATVMDAERVLGRADIRTVVAAAHDLLKAGERQGAISWLALGLRWQPERTLDEIRRDGTFRCSKYKFQSGHLRNVAEALLSRADDLSLSHDAVTYLGSVLGLLRLAASVRQLDASIREFVGRRKDRALKTVVALADSLFMRNHVSDRSRPTDDWRRYTKEELAEGCSLIVHRFEEEVGMNSSHFNWLDEVGIEAGLYHKLLVKACKIRKFMEAEVLVDAFNYRPTPRGNTVRIEPPFPDLERSTRLGYILNTLAESASQILRAEALARGEISLEGLAKKFYEKFGERIVTIAEFPARRYVFGFPDAPQFRALFEQDGLLIEEEIYLKEILHHELVTMEELTKFKINDKLSIFDLVKVYRLFGFIARIAAERFLGVFDEDPAMVYRSLVPVHPVDRFRRMLGWCLPEESVDAAIDMLSWTSGSTEMMDLQYRPFLKSDGYFLAPMFMAGSANWYRNLAFTQGQRLIDEAEEEAASRALEVTLVEATEHAKRDFEITLKGEDIEIDVIARLGDLLFVFECKHSLLPCNPHELRTSYGHMKKAGSQLTRIKRLLGQEDAEAKVYRRLGWRLSPAAEIVTCIVSCNGMFPGLDIEGHPVRRYPELRNMITSATVRVGSVSLKDANGKDSADESGVLAGSLWDGTELTPDFLRRYIKDGFLRDAQFAAMFPVEEDFSLGDMRLVFPSFALDLEKAQQNLEALLNRGEAPAEERA